MSFMDLEIKKFKGYELLDSGNEKKLERFASIVMERPSPQAIWPIKNKPLWKKADAVFQRTQQGNGDWVIKNGNSKDTFLAKIEDLNFEIRFTGFGNVGLFPEHTCHFNWLKSLIKQKKQTPSILNLFAYTGGASMLCAKSGAVVTHVDAAKSVNGWAMHNSKLSGIANGAIRYLADDALQFVKKEIRRGKSYDGIILDPPSYGRGSKGEIWKIERDFYELIENCKLLLSSDPLFLLLTSHSPGITATVLKNLINLKKVEMQSGEMLLTSTGHPLSAGVYARWSKY